MASLMAVAVAAPGTVQFASCAAGFTSSVKRVTLPSTTLLRTRSGRSSGGAIRASASSGAADESMLPESSGSTGAGDN
jgi:hypothetical protein